ncbi:bifunctional 2-C-methyl-D-erythritol 4-phosphate cytidylyltransferase/2-C-methyl-D-erythritol 2,4-cyclodiphosphate synthase [Stakelama marina]|uniref:Bifunctional enzyme IspD/IspF n=1 Tax=Stakelama marina TaxID=2826939 RepID=A0A8T4IH32_9SPHN|nr:bifunctional 2-C-methyl-D-erythritol 4-phosphate cytidylyltransferase/2-C-methyl-D-erythritol 2,4-cyclodiphosphate synthase [Stakelama marina]MBR0551599.1 bifunctional 2-C-methyl-D-erythritol 4-phosphate cytidylyltransferase/2-C-methyl-D-erythritol 2,4-cyclodiphosphate synthase [Stakelama marina]
MNAHRTVALIVAAGNGSRSGAALPKQFVRVAGKAMIAHSHAAMTSHPRIDAVLVVAGRDQGDQLRSALGDVWTVAGGETRRESVRLGLEAIAAEGGADRVLVHDAARPFLPSEVIERVLDALDDAPGAVPVLPVADTLAMASGDLGNVVPRDGIARVQTPQAFAFDAILRAHRAWPADKEATDDAQILRAAGQRVATVAGDDRLNKLTYPADFAAAEALYGRQITRSAIGFDVHRLEAGEKLWLGGVLIPHDRGLSGHSDADVALHAVTDALLGTIAAGDIGTHFPPSDPQWRGADSARFLEHAASLVTDAGGMIDFIDLTLMCEAPKIGPYRDAMRDRIASMLRLDRSRISIKATTTERLGFTGRREGIAAQAIATVRIAQ